MQRSNNTNGLISLVQLGQGASVLKKLRQGADPNEKEQEGRTPLHWAAQLGHIGILRCLVRFGADVNARDNQGFTPLVVAVGEGNLAIVKEVVKSGALPNLKISGNANGTALHLACSWEHIDVAKLLIEIAGAKLNLRDSDGKTPLGYALDAKNKRLAAYLKKHGGVA